MRQRKVVAFFDMNLRSGAPLHTVHQMLQDVRRRFSDNVSTIHVTSACKIHQRYVIAFDNRDAADMFERLYRQTGKTPRRSREMPRDLCLRFIDVAMVAALLASLDMFMAHMNPQARNAQWN